MSDPKYGEPIEEPTPVETTSVDDAVASAHAGLADAEAASREAAVDEPVVSAEPADAEVPAAPAAPVADAPRDAPETVAAAETAPAAPVYGSSYADDPVDEAYVPGAYSGAAAETVVVAEPVAPVVAPAPQPIVAEIERDTMQPGVETRPAGAPARRMAPHPDEGFLRHVLRLRGVAQHAPGERQHARQPAGDQRLHGRLFARADTADQLFVRVGTHRWRHSHGRILRSSHLLSCLSFYCAFLVAEL